MTNEIKYHERRFYQEPPEKKTPHQCESHGADHAAYGWLPQLDPRWSDEQIVAYRRGYDETKKLEKAKGLR